MHARAATPEDAADMARIYNQGIADRTATFETQPRTAGGWSPHSVSARWASTKNTVKWTACGAT
jgi:phosphinothricin acetyltransferase